MSEMSLNFALAQKETKALQHVRSNRKLARYISYQ